MAKRDALRLLRTLILGAPLVMLMLLSMVFLGIALADHPERRLLELIAAVAVFVSSLMGLLWATGWWGRWLMVVFLVAAPLVVVLDFAINPLFPVGAVLFGAVCLAAFSIRRSDA